MDKMVAAETIQLSLFEGLTQEQITHVAALLAPIEWPGDTTVFEQGQAADHLYVVIAGEVAIRYKPYDGPALVIARVTSGGIFGWSSVLGRPIYNSEAYTTQATQAYQISGHDIQTLCQQDPETGVIILERLAAVIAERLSGTYHQIMQILSDGMERNGDCRRREADHDQQRTEFFNGR